MVAGPYTVGPTDLFYYSVQVQNQEVRKTNNSIKFTYEKKTETINQRGVSNQHLKNYL